MKFSQIRDEYYAQTGKASEVGRQLTYAGFAIIWVFKTSTGMPIPRYLAPASVLLALSLLFDALQYILGSLAWKRIADAADKATASDDAEYSVPFGANTAAERCYRSKMTCLALAYGALVVGLSLLARSLH